MKTQDKELKRLMEKLLSELTSPNHIISDLLARFSELFLNKYSIFFNIDSKNNDLDMLARSFRGDITILLGLIKELIEKWYMSIVMQNGYLFKYRHKRQEFIDVLVNQTVFSNTNNIYYTLLYLYGLVNIDSEKKLDSIMELLKDITPENLEMNPVFQLNASKEPYSNVITLLNEQSAYISAYEKFQIIDKIKVEIKESIDRYWELVDPNIPAQKLAIDSDQLLTIVSYCILKTRNCKLISYLMFTKEFMNRNALENYYFITYEAALIYLLKFTEDDVNNVLKKK